MMIRYIAFLRGINVSGQKIIKMEALRQVFGDAGYENVKTYIQSGNILFTTSERTHADLISAIENLVEKAFGFRTDVILRKQSEIEAIIGSNVYSSLRQGEKKFYVTLLKDSFSELLPVPVFSKNRDVEIVLHNNMDFYTISTAHKGIYGFPNHFIERLTGIPATTRNPDTLEKLLKL